MAEPKTETTLSKYKEDLYMCVYKTVKKILIFSKRKSVEI